MITRAGQRADVAVGWRLVDACMGVHRSLSIARRSRAGVWSRAGSYLMLVPAVAVISVLGVGLLYLAWASFHSFDTFLFRQGRMSTDQYATLFSGSLAGYYRAVLVRTLVVAVVITMFSVPFGLPVAYAIVRVRSNAVRGLMLVMLLVPFLMGEAVRAFGWQLILGKQGGLAWLLGLFGVKSFNLLGTSVAVAIGLVQVSVPLVALLTLPAVRRIDPDLERAAATLGARRWRVWWHVVVPLARPGLAVGAAIAFLLAVAEYDLPDVVGQGIVPFVANAVGDIYSGENDLNLAAAFSMVLALISTLSVAGLLALAVIGRRRPGSPGRRARRRAGSHG
jgi:putative spermidine/putrescine transport system permease protein